MKQPINPRPNYVGNLDNLRLLPLSFYQQPTIKVAQDLLGCYLVLEDSSESKIGQIIETEAYPGLGDKASHSSRGLTPRTAVLFGPAGYFYVYLIYGIYYCLNVVTDTPESGGAVLIRAVTPIANLNGKTSGPGLVCKSFGIDKRFNNQLTTAGPLLIKKDPDQSVDLPITTNVRVGIDYAGSDKEHLYRFKIANSSTPIVK